MTTNSAEKRIVITGGNGFVGSHLVQELPIQYPDAELHLFDLFNEIPLNRLYTNSHNKFFCHHVDIRDFLRLKELIQQIEPSIIFHLGAYAKVGRDFSHVDKAIQINIQGTVNLLQALEQNDFSCLIHIGTSEEYGNNPVPFREDMPLDPPSPYSTSKASGEMFCRVYSKAYGFPIVYLRPFNVYGEGQTPTMLIPEIILSCLKGDDIKLTGGKQSREWNYVKDVVLAIILSSQKKCAIGKTINIGSGEEYTIRELVMIVLELMNRPIKPLFGALPYRENEIWRMFCDNSLAKEILGWEPKYDLFDGLKRTISWYQRNMNLNEK